MLDYISYYSLSFFRFSVLFYRNDLLVVTFSVPYFHMFFIHHWHFSKLLLCLYKIPSYSHGHTDAHSHLTSQSLWPIIYFYCFFYWHFLGWLFKIEDEEKKNWHWPMLLNSQGIGTGFFFNQFEMIEIERETNSWSVE